MSLAMAISFLALVATAMAACAGGGVGSNQADFIKSLASDPASNCVVVTTPYGGVILARGTPGAKVALAGGSCSIDSAPAGPSVPLTGVDVRVPVTVGTPSVIPPAKP